MGFSLIEHNNGTKVAYDSLVVHPKKLNIFNSDLSLRIVNELVRQPGCAMDLARKLEEHEQKIYYHLRKMENVGIIKITSVEKRYGMNANIYSLVSPVIAAKLYEDGKEIHVSNGTDNTEHAAFFHPFIENGSLNAKIVVGDPNEHGRFDTKSKEGTYVTDIGILLGSFVNNFNFPYFTPDTEIRESDLEKNLILIGNVRTNVIIDKIKDHLPIEFEEKGHSFLSKKTKTVHKDPRTGYIIKMKNPMNPKKQIMVIGGLRTRGTRAAVVALTQNLKKLFDKNDVNNGEFIRIVKGLDKEGRGIIDAFEIKE
ncbi:MAG: ArsR family transcriptional regulator [Candidatus Aenigmarchaeota archaeon]|nr:ArsR family transcriptional regulator [Candidatus Aenigmarchaeota archaeon]